jgi:hypothetical protein
MDYLMQKENCQKKSYLIENLFKNKLIKQSKITDTCVHEFAKISNSY